MFYKIVFAFVTGKNSPPVFTVKNAPSRFAPVKLKRFSQMKASELLDLWL